MEGFKLAASSPRAPAEPLRSSSESQSIFLNEETSAHLPEVRHDRGKGIPLCFWVKGMRGKGRGLEVHTLAYPCTLTKGIGVCLHKNIV
jgi:hypothetical protein